MDAKIDNKMDYFIDDKLDISKINIQSNRSLLTYIYSLYTQQNKDNNNVYNNVDNNVDNNIDNKIDKNLNKNII